MYESGVFEGKRYKAWHYVFDAPMSFIDIFKHEHANNSTSISEVQVNILQDKNKSSKLLLPEISLLYIYNSINIVGLKHAATIATEYGFTSESSGKSLLDDYTHYKQAPNRTNPNDSSKGSIKNMIKRIENILPKLNKEGKIRAESEIKILTQNSISR